MSSVKKGVRDQLGGGMPGCVIRPDRWTHKLIPPLVIFHMLPYDGQQGSIPLFAQSVGLGMVGGFLLYSIKCSKERLEGRRHERCSLVGYDDFWRAMPKDDAFIKKLAGTGGIGTDDWHCKHVPCVVFK